VELDLPEETAQLQRTIRQWAAARSDWPRRGHEFVPERWQEVTALGILDAEHQGGSLLDIVVAFLELGPIGMPGPVLEAHLAVAAAGEPAVARLLDGEVVTSLLPGWGEQLVAWGAEASATFDQANGSLLSDAPLPAAHLAYAMPHGWLEPPAATQSESASPDALETRRWILAAALLTGLADAAVRQTSEHAKVRSQFGKPIGSFQAVQTRLVETHLAVTAARLAVLDAAWRVVEGQAHAKSTAAIAWLGSVDAAAAADRNCHQVYGATGFTLETGLEGLSWPMWWLTASVGRAGAVAFLRGQRLREDIAATNVFELLRDQA